MLLEPTRKPLFREYKERRKKGTLKFMTSPSAVRGALFLIGNLASCHPGAERSPAAPHNVLY